MLSNLHSRVVGKISTPAYYIYRLCIFPVVTFYVSLLFLALSCAWQVPFTRFFGPAGYVIYWMLSWCAMMAFGLVIDNIHNVVGQPLTSIFFIFWVISNVATGFLPIELLSNFYRWGLAWPLRHALIGSRAVIYGTNNLLGLNFGVLLAWIAVSLALLPLTVFWQMRKQRDHIQKQQREIMDRRSS